MNCFDFLTNCHIIIDFFFFFKYYSMEKLYRSQNIKINICKASSNLRAIQWFRAIFRNSFLPIFPFCYQLFWFSHQLSYYNKCFPNLSRLSNDKVVSFTKDENVSLLSFIKSWKSISDEWFRSISWSSLLFSIFKIKIIYGI